MSALRIVFLDRSTIEAVIRAPGFDHQWVDYTVTLAEEVVPRLSGAQVAVVNKVQLGRTALERLPELRMIAICATGTDNVDLAAARERGIVAIKAASRMLIAGAVLAAAPAHVRAEQGT